MNTNNRVTIREVYELVDKKVGSLREEMQSEFDQLDTNHFQGIYKKLDRITWGLVGLLGGVVASLIILLLK